MKNNALRSLTWQLVLTAGLLGLILAAGALKKPDLGPRVEFVKKNIDLGTISDSEKKRTVFKFRNTGDATLSIEDVRTSCGCSVARIERRKIAPGGSGEIKVLVNPVAKQGKITKAVFVLTNVAEHPGTTLYIQAFVLPASQAHRDHDAMAILASDCAVCHVDRGRGKTGAELWLADCAFCHKESDGNQSSKGMEIIIESRRKGRNYLRDVIKNGKQNVPMPAWSQDRGGPLSQDQIESLVNYIETKIYDDLQHLSL